MSARELIAKHLNLWTGAVTKRSNSGRGSNGKVELTGIKKLRELILELAISGRLVEPERNDESAHQLLSSIKAEKSLLVAKGIIKKPKKLAALDGSEPYPLPPHWCWARLGDVTNYGTTDKAEPNQVANDTWVLELEDIEKESSRLLNKIRYTERQFKSSKNRFERGDVLYGKLRPYLDKVLVADEPGVCTTEIIPIRGYLGISPEFLRLALKSPSFKHYANDSTHGMNLPRLGTDKARMAMIPLAPAQEQHRIVQKVDELMALCDRLEQQTSNQLEAHETLVDTLLGTLTQSENATELADNWARLAAHFEILFTTEKSIDKLKQTILQLAVMGRLVEQDVGGDSAKRLLASIERRKQELVEAKQIKTPKKLPAITSEEALFDIPQNWQWVKFGELGLFINGDRSKNYPNKEEYVERGVAWINTGHIEPSGTLTRTHMHFITRKKYDSLRSGKIEPTDLVYCLRGATFGKTAFVTPYEEGAIASSLMIIRPYLPAMRSYIYRYLTSPFGRSQIFRFDNGSAQPNLSANSVMMYAFPLPPLEEQHRIVQKVDELMALGDQLKERLNQASETRCQLAESVIEKSLI